MTEPAEPAEPAGPSEAAEPASPCRTAVQRLIAKNHAAAALKGKKPSSSDEAASNEAPKGANPNPGGSLKKGFTGSASSRSMQQVLAKNRVAKVLGRQPSHADEATNLEPNPPTERSFAKARPAPAGVIRKTKSLQSAVARNRVAALLGKGSADEEDESVRGRRGAIRRGSTMHSEISKKLETGELTSMAIGAPPKKDAGSFRSSMIRRQVYAGMKTSMQENSTPVEDLQDPESRPNESVKEVRKLKDFAQGMVRSTRIVLAKERVTGAFVTGKEEKKIRDLLVKKTSEFMKCQEWSTLQNELGELREGTYELERKFNGMINLLDIRLDIDKMLVAVERNNTSKVKSASVRELFTHLADIPMSTAEEAEDLWAKLVEAEQVLAQTKECNTVLLEMAANNGNNAHHIDAGSAAKAVELPEKIAALLGAMSEEALDDLKSIIVSQSDGHSRAEVIEECTTILTGLGCTAQEIPRVIDEIEREAWEDMAHSGMEMFELESGQGSAAEEIAIMKQKLAEKYPHLCKIQSPSHSNVSPRRKDGGRLAVLRRSCMLTMAEAVALETPEEVPTPGAPGASFEEMPGQACDNPEPGDAKWPEEHMLAHAAPTLAASSTPEAGDTRSSSKESPVVSVATLVPAGDMAEVEPAPATSDLAGSEPGLEPGDSKPLEEPQGAIEQNVGLATPERIPTPEVPMANTEDTLEQAAEERRLAEEEKERQGAEERRLAEEEKERQGAEERRLAEEQKERQAAEERRLAEEQKERQAAEERRLAEEKKELLAAEKKRLADEEKERLAEEETERQEAEERRLAEEEKERLAAEERRLAEEPVMSYSDRFARIHSERIAPVVLKKPRVNRRLAISAQLEEFECSHLSSFARSMGSKHESHSLTHIALSLASLRQHLLRVWKGIEEAATFIAGRSMLEQPDMLAMSTLVDALQKSGYPCDSGEICILFSVLGVKLTDEGTLSKAGFMRLSELEQRCGYDERGSDNVKIASDSLRIHQTHRVLVQSLSNSERILAEMRIAKAREIGEVEEDSLLRNWPSLAETLEKCLVELAGAEAEAFAKTLLSKCGLLLLVEIMVSTSIQSDLRALSVSVASLAVEILGGADFQARPVAEAQAMAASSANWLSNSRVYSGAVVACQARLFHETVRSEKHLSTVAFPSLSTAPRFRVPTPPTTVDDRKPTKLELSLASFLWRPILEHIDPEEVKPEPLTPHIFAQILALMRQTHLDFVVVGACGARLMLHIGSALRRLQGSGRRQMDTQKVVAAIDELCDCCVSPRVVHQIAAALGGRRLLRDRLQMLGANADATLLQSCERLYDAWCYERKRLAVRWVQPVAKWKDDAKINAIMKTVEITGAEGLRPMLEESLPMSRPSLLTAPSPPRTANLHPSPRLQLQGLHSGNEDGLISWLDNQSDSSGYVPHGFHQRNRERSHKGAHDTKRAIFKLPQVSMQSKAKRIGWDPWKFDG